MVKTMQTEEHIAINYKIKQPKKKDGLKLFSFILSAKVRNLEGQIEKKINLCLHIDQQALLNLAEEIKKEIHDYENQFDDVYILNDYLKLKYENGKTRIYINDKYFRVCTYLLLNIPKDDVRDYDEIVSIDEAEEVLSHELHNPETEAQDFGVDPKEEFIGHCSNLQAWVENDYNTQILHRTLAFPILKALVKAGDPKAKRSYKEEIAYRLEANELTVGIFLIEKGYLGDLTDDELEIIIENMKPGIGKLFLQEYAKKRRIPYNFDSKKMVLVIVNDEMELASYERNTFTFNDYKKPFLVRFLDKFSRILYNSLVDFGITWNQQRVLFKQSNIVRAIDYFENKDKIRVEIPRTMAPLKLFVKEENLAIFIYPKLMY